MKVLHLNAGNETGGGMYHILRVLSKLQEKKSLSCVLGVMEQEQLYKRARALHIPIKYFENKTRLSLPLLKKIYQYIKNENITHVHTHGPRASVYINYIRRFIPINWVVTVHSDPFFDFRDRGVLGHLLTKTHVNAIKNADRIISVSKSVYPKLIEAGVRPENITTIYNGINFQSEISEELSTEIVGGKILSREQLGFNQKDFIFLQVARLEKVKGHHLAFKAFAKLIHDAEGSFHLLLLGDGTLKKELMQLAKDLDISSFVHFYGERDDVTHFYQMANVTILTSLSEGFPYVLLESAREKTPIIATDVGDVGQLLSNDNLGWKVPVNDINALTDAMKNAHQLFQLNKLELLGENLYTHALNYFSIDICVDDVYNVYRSM